MQSSDSACDRLPIREPCTWSVYIYTHIHTRGTGNITWIVNPIEVLSLQPICSKRRNWFGNSAAKPQKYNDIGERTIVCWALTGNAGLKLAEKVLVRKIEWAMSNLFFHFWDFAQSLQILKKENNAQLHFVPPWSFLKQLSTCYAVLLLWSECKLLFPYQLKKN